jgi:hypothetical protein
MHYKKKLRKLMNAIGTAYRKSAVQNEMRGNS